MSRPSSDHPRLDNGASFLIVPTDTSDNNTHCYSMLIRGNAPENYSCAFSTSPYEWLTFFGKEGKSQSAIPPEKIVETIPPEVKDMLEAALQSIS